MPDEFERPGRDLDTVSDLQGEVGTRERARAAGRDLLDRAVEKKDELKERASTLADDRRTGVADRASSISRALHGAADTLRENGEPQLSEWVHQAAGQVERVAGYLQGKRVDGMADDLEGMARSNPALFLGGTYVAGLALGRFLRATSPERREARVDDRNEAFEDGMGGSFDRTGLEGTASVSGNLGTTGWSGVGVAPGAFGGSTSEPAPRSRSRGEGESGMGMDTMRGAGSGSETDVFGVGEHDTSDPGRDFRAAGSDALGRPASSSLGASPSSRPREPEKRDPGRTAQRGAGAPETPKPGDRDMIQTDRDLHEAPPREDRPGGDRNRERGV